MKTKITSRKYMMGTLLLMFTFLFASISIGQSEYYYYYKGGKISLDLNTEKVNISVFQNFQKDNLRALKLKAYNLDKDLSQNKVSSLRYAEIEFETSYSDAEYFKKLEEIKKTQDVRTVYPSFLSADGTEIGLSDYIYVKLKSSADYSDIERKAAEYDLVIVEQNKYMPLWYTLRCSENTEFSSLEVANRMFETDLFASSVADLMTSDDIECTNDPDFNQLWGMQNTVDPSADINACDAWTITKGSGINVAVLDQGIELTHIDLAANLSPLSYDTESNTSPSQMFGYHGTHCAGTVGAVGDNNTQVVGAAPECTLVSISNSLASTPNSRQKRADGFNWAVANGVDVVSNSWGSGVQYDVIDDAIDLALTNGRGGLGCIIVFAAGNNYGSPVSYPCNYTGAILAVGSITSTGARSNFSNIGPKLDVVAPGSNILSTMPNNLTGPLSGTSMATPHVAGLAALILSVNPCLTGLQVNDIIEQSCQKSGGYVYSPTIGRPNGTWNNEMGYGLIDAHAAVLLAQSVSCSGSCSSTITAFPYTESFETDFGGWEQEASDDFDWTRNSGGTSSFNTGPSAAADGSFYAYTESSYPNYPSKTSILNSPCFDFTNEINPTISFQYHMYGAAMGKLLLEISDDNGTTWTSIWGKKNDQGNQWFTASVDLSAYTGSIVQLRYKGLTSNSYTSDMAIDDIKISTLPCAGVVTSFPYTESFETDFGIWSQDLTEDFDWSRNSGSTPSIGTGPSSATDGLWYAYIESSFPNYPSKAAFLNSPCLDFTGQSTIVINFAYHMLGSTIGTLALEITTDGGNSWTTLFVKTGEQSKTWIPTSVNLSAYAGTFAQLRFVGKTTTSYTSDIAIDDIQIVVLKGIGKSASGSELISESSDKLEIYPNPASDRAIVRFSSLDSDEINISVMDMLGKEVYNLQTPVSDSENEFAIPTHSFAPGSYMVVIKTNTGATFNRKLIVRQ